MATRLLWLIWAASLPLAAWADGKVFKAQQAYASIPIPDQQALICFRNGVEHLVIETSFIAEGTDFGWVVPVPSEPAVEAATRGLFPTLRTIFQPVVLTRPDPTVCLASLGLYLLYVVFFLRRSGEVVPLDYAAALLPGVAVGVQLGGPGWLLAAWISGWLLLVAADIRRRRSVFWAILLGFIVPFFLAGLLLPALAQRGKGAKEALSDGSVRLVARQRAGVFDTTTLTAKDPQALHGWFQANGFALPPGLGPVLSNYVREGWFFVAARARVEAGALSTNVLHPLAFTFRTPCPVYPLRLTGVDNDRCRVDLYVFGPGEAAAPGFHVVRCETVGATTQSNVFRLAPGPLRVRHPELAKWAAELPVATQLTANLSAADLRADAWLEWRSPRQTGGEVHSRAAALGFAVNLGWIVLCLALACAHRWPACAWSAGPAPRLGLLSLGSVVVAAIVFAAMPKVDVELRPGGIRAASQGRSVSHNLLAEISQDPSNAAVLLDAALRRGNHQNIFTGAAARREDSPGNYTCRPASNGVDLLWYDFDGAPQSWPSESARELMLPPIHFQRQPP